MKRFRVLIILQIKRYLKVFPGLLFAALALVLVVSGIALTGSKLLNSTSAESITKEGGEGSKIPVGITAEDSSNGMNMVKTMIKNMESVNTILDLQYVSEIEGRKLLDQESIAVLIIIREGTISGIMSGDNMPIEIMFPRNSGYEAAIFKEFADAAINMLSASQAAIYSVYDFYEDYGKYNLRKDAVDRLNMYYIAAALNRENIYDQEEVVATGELSVEEYYKCGGLALFAMFFVIILTNVMKRSSRDISSRLRLTGTGDVKQIVAGMIGIVVSFILIIVIMLVGIVLCTDLLEISLALKILFYMIPISVVISAFGIMVCRLTDNSMAQVMFLFISALVQGFVTGCFVPKLLLPEVLEPIAALFPAHYMIELLSGLYIRNNMPQCVGMLFLYTVLFVVIGAALNRKGKVS